MPILSPAGRLLAFATTLVLLAFLAAACSSAEAQGEDHASRNATVIYLSRHAEKAGGEDPGLLPDGAARAERLATRLAGKNVAAVYATGFRRTQATAQPTANAAGTMVQEYAAGGNPATLTRDWLNRHRGQTILVVGHSNTVPGLVNALIGESRFGDLEEEEYGKLYRVTIPAKGKAKVQELSSN